METKIYSAAALYEKLAGEHAEGQYFRGQTREYPGPLWPSCYRLNERSEHSFTIENNSRLRGTGKKFYFRSDYLQRDGFNSEDAYQSYIRKTNLKHFIILQIRNALGYPLTQAFCQQAGMSSEGLDVTSDLKVAFFFAMFDFNGKEYKLKTEVDKPGVIYRWRFEKVAWSREDLNRYDFYTCPRLIPVHDIFQSFAVCETQEECRRSIETYRSAIDWRFMKFNLDRIRGKRPFHLLKLPLKNLASCRVMRQRAALLIPDMVLSQQYNKLGFSHDPPRTSEYLKEGAFVEDLAADPACDRFYFTMNESLKLDWFAEIEAAEIVPKEDIIFTILRGWPRALMQNDYLTLPLFGNPLDMELLGPDQIKFLTMILNNIEEEFFS